MRLSDIVMRNMSVEGGLITPFDENLLNSASYDVTWSGRYMVYNPWKLFKKNKWSRLEFSNRLTIRRGFYYLLDTEQYFKIPLRLSATLFLKSTCARLGLQHAMAGFADPGFEGTLTLEIFTMAENIDLKKGDRIAQVCFDEIYEPEKSYTQRTGHYQYQNVPTRGNANNLKME